MLDDDDGARGAMVRELRRGGFEVEAIGTTSTDLEHLEGFDVFVLDVYLRSGPRAGVAFARAIRIRWPRALIVMVTGDASLAGRLEGELCLAKPWALGYLCHVILERLGNGA